MAEPVIVWFRRDLRLADNPALRAAVDAGAPIVPLYVLDETAGARPPGAASRWWLDKSLRNLGRSLEALGAPLVLRRGPAAEVLAAVGRETGAGAIYCNRLYAPGEADLMAAVASATMVRCFNGSLLKDPSEVATGAGTPYQVFTAFWRAVRPTIEAGDPTPAPKAIRPPDGAPRSDDLADWGLHPKRPDWSGGFGDWTPGEAGAMESLADFVDERLRDYPTGRDRPDRNGSSRLSPHLHFGEIGPLQVWRAVQAAVARGVAGEGAAETFLAEIGWREFDHHLLAARPDLDTANVRPQFDRLAWRRDPQGLEAWRRGLTGFPLVDAGMRQLWATGWMHNRVRMVVGSFLVKDLLIDWREGERWFWDTLVDADAANNAANWQWVAGSGADAAPFFRIFNPIAQGRRFDPDGAYVRRWVPELEGLPPGQIHDPAHTAGVNGYPAPIVDHGRARERALAALKEADGP